MILGRFPTSNDKPNVHNTLAVTVTIGGGVCLFCDLKDRTSKLEYETTNIKNGLFPLIQKPFSYPGLWRIRP